MTGTMVDFKITASNVNGEGPPSNVLTVYIAKKPEAPAAVSEVAINLIDTKSDRLSITVQWDEPLDNGAPITGYKLWMAEEEKSYKLVYNGAQRSDILSFTVSAGI